MKSCPLNMEEWDGQDFDKREDLSQDEIEQIYKDAEDARKRLQESGILQS